MHCRRDEQGSSSRMGMSMPLAAGGTPVTHPPTPRRGLRDEPRFPPWTGGTPCALRAAPACLRACAERVGYTGWPGLAQWPTSRREHRRIEKKLHRARDVAYGGNDRPSARGRGRRRSRRCAIRRSGCSGSVARRPSRPPVAAPPPNPRRHSLLSASQPTMNKPDQSPIHGAILIQCGRTRVEPYTGCGNDCWHVWCGQMVSGKDSVVSVL